jgi:hypothetical protein
VGRAPLLRSTADASLKNCTIADKPRFRLTAPIPSENDLHEAVAEALDRLLMPPARWTTFPAGHVPLPARYAVKLARLGLKRNWPDILVLHCGATHGIELKRPGERLSIARWIVNRRTGARRYVEGQREEFPRLEAAGMRVAVCETVVAVLDALAGWGVPLRGRITA